MRSAALILCLLGMLAAPALGAGKVKKVLPQFLDLKGRHTLSPSLYERDAYQAYLRKNPALRSGIQMNIHWRPANFNPHLLRVELRGSRGDTPTQTTLTKTVKPNTGWARWTTLAIAGQKYKDFGELIAWRVTIWDGESLVAEQTSFLWSTGPAAPAAKPEP